MSPSDRWRLWVSTLGPVGYVPRWPGTAGSLAALGISLVWGDGPPWALAAVILGGLALALASIRRATELLGHPDPPQIVVDEALGMLIAIWGVPPARSIAAYLAAFGLFRVLDVAKPWPLRRLERWPAPYGVLADDIAAGVVVNLVMRWLT